MPRVNHRNLSGTLEFFPLRDISQGPSACFHYMRFFNNVVSVFLLQNINFSGTFGLVSNMRNFLECQGPFYLMAFN